MPNKKIKYLYILCVFQILLTGVLFLYLSITYPSTIASDGDYVIHNIEKSTDINELKEISEQLLKRIEFLNNCNGIITVIVIYFTISMIFLLGVSLILIRNLKKELSRLSRDEKHNGDIEIK